MIAGGTVLHGAAGGPREAGVAAVGAAEVAGGDVLTHAAGHR